ncbi:MAG: signal peptide peptidase SppA [Bacteroidota bacterium]
MQQFFKFVFASCLGIALFTLAFSFFLIAVAGGAAASFGAKQGAEVKPNSVLEITFDAPIPEKTNNVQPQGFTLEPEEVVGLFDMVDAIEHAKTDDDIKGIFLDVSMVPGGMVTRSTLRDALVDFKESGKFIVAYAKFYTQNGYYMASVADDISVHPIGTIDFRGYGAQIPFYKNMLDKIGVKMEVYYAGQFKSATEPYRLTEMSDQNRRQIKEYLEPLYQTFLNDIGEARDIAPDELRRIANGWLIREAEDAVTYKLADRVGYKDEVLDVLREKIGLEDDDKIYKINLKDYAGKVRPKTNFNVKDKIAVIFAEGTIVMGGKDVAGSVSDEDYGPMIRKIRKDDKIKGIVLRVNSGGGSALTSESLWQELSLAMEEGKPVVVSMGDYAASGGYYIACMADKIFAEPNTITGSIGIFSMIPNASELLNDKIGISLDTLNLGQYASSINGFHDHAPDEAAIIQEMTDNGYEMFLKRVSEGRDMTRDEVHEIAQGRVWTGEKALEIGLVDELGDLEDAIAEVKELAGLQEYRISEYPKVKDPFQQLIDQLLNPSNATANAKAAVLREELGPLYPAYQQFKEIKETTGLQARMPFLIDVQ